MDSHKKIHQLKSIIYNSLAPLIDNEYVLLDIPSHNNLGDTLIAQGELDFLKKINQKCVGLSLTNCFYFENHINNDTIILFHGGGNFGDLYTIHNNFRKQIITKYPHNKVIIFPQTVWYKDPENLIKDANFFASYPNVTICARDQRSLSILQTYFVNNKSMLVPDMAFCINPNRLKINQDAEGALLIQRTDIESSPIPYDINRENLVITDWPLFNETNCQLFRNLKRFILLSSSIDKRLHTKIRLWIYNLYWMEFILPFLVSKSICFISAYKCVFSTRLHGCILSLLLHKNSIIVIDNSYGKNSSFVKTWLSDVDGLNLIEHIQ